jgi:hypothetical protein
VLVIGSAIVAAIVGSLSDLGDVLVGLVRFDFGIPHAAVTAGLVPNPRRIDRVRRPVRHAADVVHAVAARQGRRHGRPHAARPRPAARR